jgi:hypothetical protein
MDTPVAFLIFNRPDSTRRVFEAIRRARPKQLLVVADGARSDHPTDAELCQATRAVIKEVDWDCQVLLNYADVNLGCGLRQSTGISWVFEQVEAAIILEDDCLPHPSFFPYCEALLHAYRDDERVMHIAGTNFQFGREPSLYSYYFSRYAHCWGWASWRRAWQHFDFSMKLWPQFRSQQWLAGCLETQRALAFWHRAFDGVYSQDKMHIWSYQWMFACWSQNGLSILPKVNLISNIGFYPGATHTNTPSDRSPFANMRVEELTLPLQHPPYVMRNVEADAFTQMTYYDLALYIRAMWKVQRMLGVKPAWFRQQVPIY